MALTHTSQFICTDDFREEIRQNPPPVSGAELIPLEMPGFIGASLFGGVGEKIGDLVESVNMPYLSFGDV